jgi:hypothetical protein
MRCRQGHPRGQNYCVVIPSRRSRQYVRAASSDRAVRPEKQCFVAKRMGATTCDIDSSHVPMLSHPDYVLDVIGARHRGNLSQQSRTSRLPGVR